MSQAQIESVGIVWLIFRVRGVPVALTAAGGYEEALAGALRPGLGLWTLTVTEGGEAALSARFRLPGIDREHL